MRAIKHILTGFCIPLILLTGLWISANLKWSKDNWKLVFLSDGKGYYSYLPATFIYHDLNFGFFDTVEQRYFTAQTEYDYRMHPDGITIDKYFAGTAIMQMPFFLIGHTFTLASNEPADGYSKWYAIWVCIGAIFWLTAGLVYLKKFLKMHGAGDEWIAFILYVIFFGTNLFYYTLVEPCMSHVYSFALISMFLYYSKSWLSTANTRHALLSLLLLGMIFAVRPVNVFIAFWLIIEAGGFRNLYNAKRKFLRSFRNISFGLLLVALPFFLQMLIWKIQTGNWLVNSYSEERFYFSQPHMIDFLFSFKKGLFIYLPVTMVALFGLWPLAKKDPGKAVSIFIFLFALIYILSSWWMWYYGGSFGTRVIAEYLPVFALLLYVLLANSGKLKIPLIALVVILTLFCQFQTYQYRYELIHWSDMTAEKYREVFGRVP